MNKQPLINILTRTSNRPNGFRMNRESIENQTYRNIRHLVSVDDSTTEDYVKEYTDDYILVNIEALERRDNSKDPNTGGRAIHNLYFNELLKEIKEGWVMFLDDDDTLVDETVIQKIVDNINSEDDLLMWQMDFPSSMNPVLPPKELVGKKPRLGKIGTPCFLFHSKYTSQVQWDGWRCSDFRFVSKIYDIIPNKIVIPKILIRVGQIGGGNRTDLPIKEVPAIKYESVLTESNDKVGVIFCNWKRVDSIPRIMACLNKQTYENFEIFIWNNNPKDKEYLSKIDGVNVFNSKINVGGIGRFYLARMINHEYSKIIFFDDDQTFGEDFISKMVEHYEPKTIKSRWGWEFKNNVSYFDRTRVIGGELADYVGTGGMILDSEIFNHNLIFEIPEEFKFIEDLWLSYVSNMVGFKNYGIDETLTQHKDGLDQYETLRNKKDTFYRFLLNEKGWGIQSRLKDDGGFSIIITAFNAVDYIEECLDSIQNQDFFKYNSNYEIILGIDGCMGTLEKVNEIKDKYKNILILFFPVNMGTYVTTNSLLMEISYENVIRFDSDDIMLPDMVSKINNHIGQHKIINFGAYNFTHPNLNEYEIKKHHDGVCYHHTDVFKKVGGYKAWRCAADSDLLNRIDGVFDRYKSEMVLYYRRIHPNSLTKHKDTNHESELRDSYKKLLKKGFEYVDFVTNEYVVVKDNRKYIKKILGDD